MPFLCFNGIYRYKIILSRFFAIALGAPSKKTCNEMAPCIVSRMKCILRSSHFISISKSPVSVLPKFIAIHTSQIKIFRISTFTCGAKKEVAKSHQNIFEELGPFIHRNMLIITPRLSYQWLLLCSRRRVEIYDHLSFTLPCVGMWQARDIKRRPLNVGIVTLVKAC